MDSVSQRRFGIVLVSAFIVGIAGTALAMALHLSAGESYTPWSNYISDLSVGPGGSNVVFVVMMLYLGGATGWFFVTAARPLQVSFGSAGAANTARLFGAIGTIDVFVMVFFPMDPTRPAVFRAHAITGVIVFLCMSVYLASYYVVFRRGAGLFKIAGISAGIGSPLAFVFAVLLFLTELAKVMPRWTVTYLFEWVAFNCFGLWMLFAGLQFLGESKRPAGT